MKFIIQICVSTLAILVTSYLLNSAVHVDSFLTALVLAAVLAFLNAVIKPLMIIFTIPVTILSFGLFLLVINACIILMADRLIDGFEIRNFWWALLFSIILSFITSIFNRIQKGNQENS